MKILSIYQLPSLRTIAVHPCEVPNGMRAFGIVQTAVVDEGPQQQLALPLENPIKGTCPVIVPQS